MMDYARCSELNAGAKDTNFSQTVSQDGDSASAAKKCCTSRRSRERNMGGRLAEGMAVRTAQQTRVADYQHAAIPGIPDETSRPLLEGDDCLR